MSRWWHKVQQALPKPSSLKKTASENVSFVQKKYGGVAKDKVDDLKKKGMAMHNGKQLTALAREWAQEATSRLGKRVADNARALPSKAAEVAKEAAKGAAAAGCTATKTVASAGAQSVRDAGKRATDSFWDAAPKIGSYASWTGRRIALLFLGTAFVYGVGSSIPGAIARYYTEKDRRRKEDGGGGGEKGGDTSFSSSPRVAEGGAELVEVVEASSLLLRGAVEQWLGRR